MKLKKAIFSGIAALLMAALVAVNPLLAVVVASGGPLSPRLEEGHYLLVHWHLLALMAASFLVFATGFFWEYRRR